MPDLAEFLTARLEEDGRGALAAIDERANGKPEHWRWECADDDEPIDVDLAIASNAEFLEHGEHFRVGLRSAEDYPSSAGPYGHLVLEGEEVRPQDARHIARHDPARVLRDVEAGRKILADVIPEIVEMHQVIISEFATGPAAPDAHLPLLRIMAAAYSDHPDYDPAWAPA